VQDRDYGTSFLHIHRV